MFLPVLLIERFGWGGFIAFAVPNVLGCTAMGFLWKRGQTPLPAHGPMLAGFSIVTVAFQVFFATWLVSELVPNMSLPWWAAPAVGLVAYLIGLVFSFSSDRDWLGLSLATYALSLAAVFVIGGAGVDRVSMRGSLPDDRLWWLVPTLCFGFGLCPYLDLTFHRAARAASSSRAAFSVFGVAFAIMLALTVLLWFSPDVWYRRAAALVAIGHIFAQLIFTIGVHLREVRLSPSFSRPIARLIAIALPAIAVGSLALARALIDRDHAGEWTYLGFLSCYGLIFPAYVMVAIVSGRPLRSAGEWIAFGVVIVASIPLYAKGFLFDQTPWLVAPVALFVVWGLWRRALRT